MEVPASAKAIRDNELMFVLDERVLRQRIIETRRVFCPSKFENRLQIFFWFPWIATDISLGHNTRSLLIRMNFLLWRRLIKTILGWQPVCVRNLSIVHHFFFHKQQRMFHCVTTPALFWCWRNSRCKSRSNKNKSMYSFRISRLI